VRIPRKCCAFPYNLPFIVDIDRFAVAPAKGPEVDYAYRLDFAHGSDVVTATPTATRKKHQRKQ